MTILCHKRRSFSHNSRQAIEEIKTYDPDIVWLNSINDRLKIQATNHPGVIACNFVIIITKVTSQNAIDNALNVEYPLFPCMMISEVYTIIRLICII